MDHHTFPHTENLLRTALSAAVPLRILMHVERGGISDEDLARVRSFARDLSGLQGTDLFFKSQQPGATAERFNQLAEALAVLSFQPGGVTFLGMHFEAQGMSAWFKRAGRADEGEQDASSQTEREAPAAPSEAAPADSSPPPPPESLQ